MVGSVHRLHMLYDLSAHIYTLVLCASVIYIGYGPPYPYYIYYYPLHPLEVIIRAVEIKFYSSMSSLQFPKS